MAEYGYPLDQTVDSSQAMIFQDIIPCGKGYIYHRENSGIFTLRAPQYSNPCQRFARFQVTYNGNIAVPTGETPGEISIAIAIAGEPIITSRARTTPAVAEAFFNVTSTAIIDVPAGCCTNISVENTSDISITAANSNLVINRVA